MVKFKVKKKHLVGQISDFPKHIVQLMVDEQVRQGNKADPNVFACDLLSDQNTGGFTWYNTSLGHDLWNKVINLKRFNLIPKPTGHIHAKAMRKYAKDAMINEKPWELWEMRVHESEPWKPLPMTHPKWALTVEYRRKSEAIAVPTPVEPNEIIKSMLDNDMTVWATISDTSYEHARSLIGKTLHRIVSVDSPEELPVITATSTGWKFAVPVDTTTMTEITELPESNKKG